MTIPATIFLRAIALADDGADVARDEILLGIPIVIGFLIVAVVAGKLLSALKNRRFTRAWAPLVPLVGGKIVTDGGAATSSWLTGTYWGQRLHAKMTPERNRISGETGWRYNSFEIDLLDLPGGQDWTIEHTQGFLGLGEAGWQITSPDPALADRLHRAGALDIAAQLGQPTLRYRARQGTLSYDGDVTPRLAPTTEQFQATLALLIALGQLNAQANPYTRQAV